MASLLCKNPPRSAGYDDPDKLGDTAQETFVPGQCKTSGYFNPRFPAPAPAKYTEEDLWTMTMFYIDLFLQAKANRLNSAGQ